MAILSRKFYEIAQQLGALSPKPPSTMRFSCTNSLSSIATFLNDKILTYGSSPPPLNKLLFARLVEIWLNRSCIGSMIKKRISFAILYGAPKVK